MARLYGQSPEKIVIGEPEVEYTSVQVGAYTLTGTKKTLQSFFQVIGEERFLETVKNEDFKILINGEGKEDQEFFFSLSGEKRFDVSFCWRVNLFLSAKPLV